MKNTTRDWSYTIQLDVISIYSPTGERVLSFELTGLWDLAGDLLGKPRLGVKTGVEPLNPRGWDGVGDGDPEIYRGPPGDGTVWFRATFEEAWLVAARGRLAYDLSRIPATRALRDAPRWERAEERADLTALAAEVQALDPWPQYETEWAPARPPWAA